MGKDFFPCATNNWKTTEYESQPCALLVTVTNLSRPYQEILIVSSPHAAIRPDKTRRDGHLATDQTRRPPSNHAKR
ncbi:hypothetical protein GGI42DRAFT_235371 [Trichoderma sp. SZMC 28013]